MKYRPVLSLLLLAAMAMPMTAQRSSRSLEGPWRTWMLNSRQPVTGPDTLYVKLPHNWDDYYGYRQMTHGNLHGTAVYETWFRLDGEESPAARRQHYFLRFEGVGSYAHVRLNGRDLGRHPGGRVSFTLDITEAIQAGDNYLEVTAEHPDLISDLPCVCGGCSSEWGFSEGSQPLGIYRPVVLEITDDVRIEPFGQHVWHDDEAKTLFFEVEIKNYGSTDRVCWLENTVLRPDGRQSLRQSHLISLKAGESVTVKSSAPIVSPEYWSLEEPVLYQLVSRLKNDRDKSQSFDITSAQFGIRTISWPVKRRQVNPDDQDGRFFLNGEPVFLNGICEYEHLLGQGHAFSEAQITARVELMRQAGFNAFRDAHQPHNLLYQQYWDRYGILFWPQLSAHIWYDTPEFRENFKAQLRQWVKERRNSPSVVLWGLQNESTLPEDFARECCDIIREMDPTAVHMRAITTCNGGVGTDWNVVQNWSGTYSGHPENYDLELSQPSQLLNGEYGAWRIFTLHEEPDDFKQSGSYTEERFGRLMEMKIGLAEAARDKVCGQFLWLWNSHDNPGRQQPDEAWRLIDRVGPVNYKGLVTPWDEPTDAFYLYRSNYVDPEDDPMVYLLSHTWPQRFADRLQSGNEHPFVTATIEAYTNCDSVRLYNGQQWIGSAVNTREKGSHLVFPSRVIRYNQLRAEAYYEGQVAARDVISLQGLPEDPKSKHPRHLDNDPLQGAKDYEYIYRINCGGDDYTDHLGQFWSQDNLLYSHSWAQDFDSLNPYQASQRLTADPIEDCLDQPLLGQFRFGRHRLNYRFPLPDGDYRVELYFIEPWYGTGGAADAGGLRIFDVAFNGQIVIDDLDIWAEAGHDKVLKKVIETRIEGGGLHLDFPEVQVGQAVISAIAIASQDKQALKIIKQSKWLRADKKRHTMQTTAAWISGQWLPSDTALYRRYVSEWSWQQADQQRQERLPADQLPGDVNPRTKLNYLATDAAFAGSASQGMQRSKDCIVWSENHPDNSIRWEINVGLAQIYALRFNYRNLSDHDLLLHMEIRASSDNRLIKSAQLTFPMNDRGWKALSTTTGSYINAGSYQVVLKAEDMSGFSIESLDVQ